jgi:putative transposase
VLNQRNDFLHKTANYYIANYNKIYIEDLNISGMLRNHSLAQSITDASWGKFFELLKYKAEEASRAVIKVPRFEPTSKTCSACGAINQELKLSERQWICKFCGALHDRDYNASKNILRVGQTQQMLTYGNSQSVVCESPNGECQEYGHEILLFNEEYNSTTKFNPKIQKRSLEASNKFRQAVR